jgi:hypothetical protein
MKRTPRDPMVWVVTLWINGWPHDITLGGCGIWWLIDLFTASSRADDLNRRKAREIIDGIQLSARS